MAQWCAGHGAQSRCLTQIGTYTRKGITMFKHKFTMDLSEKVTLPGGKKKHKKVGEASIPVPVLSDFGIDARQAVYEESNEKEGKVKGEPAFENGVL